MRLIDADKTIERIEDDFKGYMLDEGCVPYDFVNILDDMPTVCDIEQIRAEIQKVMSTERDLSTDNAKAQYIALGWCLEIIDKHTKGAEE